MFRLEKLDIHGFKSFYDPAHLTFPAAMTAVVGPNGCGKSNICDALIWVLGENRASHIRGETMEDVIFQGSARKRALSMGEVTLTLGTSNGDGNHPMADDGKITINRRVFRDGQSEFRLNGKRVRMKDISDILMDTGLGIRNYSVMEQGKIDLILSNKPQDRRRLIEEAAGITKYKTKRRAAELKLEETQQNLLRIDDTLSEVTRNLNSLKRQASKARRHKELADQLSTAKRSLYKGRIVAAQLEEEQASAALAEAQQRESELSATLGGAESELNETRGLHATRASRASHVREELAGLTGEVERLRSFLQQSETNLGDLVQRVDNARAQIATLEAEGAEQQAALDEKTQQLEAARAERNRLREIADQAERDRQERGDAVRQHEKSLADSRESLMRTIARISEARNQVHQIEIAVEKCEFYLTKLTESARKAAESRDGARAQMYEWEQSVRDAEQALATAQQNARDAVARRDELLARRDALRESLAGARDRVSQTTYKIDSLRTLLVSLEAQDEDVRRAILELIPNAVAAAESVRAAEGFEAALDTLLREVSKAIVVDDTATASEAIRRLRERGAGRGAFILLDYQPAGEGSRRGDAAHSVVGEGRVADAVRHAIPEAYIVGALSEAIERAKERPSATFVTLEGDIVRGPLVIGGKTEGATPGVFSIKREIADLEALAGSEESRASGFAAELQTLEEELRAADDARIIADERARTADQELREKRSQRERAGTELQRFEKDLAVASEEQTLYADEKEQLLGRKNAAIADVDQLQAREAELHEQIRVAEERLAASRTAFEEVTEAASKARVDVETASGNVNSIQREHENLSRIVVSLGSRATQLQQEIETLVRRQGDTGVALEASRGQLAQSATKLQELGELRTSVEAEVAELDARVAELQSRAHSSREQWTAAKDALFEAERRVDRAKSAFDILREQISFDLHAGIDALADVEPPTDEESRATLESDVAKLSDQIEKIGPVNVLAIDEHTELETRESFLRTQRDDLVQSIESLRQTIRKINLTSRDLFREAFTQVNESFTHIFTSLFGGGTARMQLLDEEDVLESGIELVAQPPGKKNQSIALLSGGERALTAIALLFAIFRYKPSPFCILDEVDAPLDEVNTERFVRLVRDMSRDTQFIVITHSRRTMEAADVLYGVTMEEAGCSRLVSVNFAEMDA
ncbi:MAG: chromosome segregation protein SMC [Acidobacteria bacterium]|nr:chromosome segregation protein SMC [Acidobacteriota bacterium]MBV9478196.1 chromosome segregation protein SMC [Acidobacteriota bacterium]